MTQDSDNATRRQTPPWLARCPECGYDLTGTDLDAKPCPECGWEATERARRMAERRWRYVRASRRLVPAHVLLVLLLPLLLERTTHLIVAGSFSRVFTWGSSIVYQVGPIMAGMLASVGAALLIRRQERVLSVCHACRSFLWTEMPLVAGACLVVGARLWMRWVARGWTPGTGDTRFNDVATRASRFVDGAYPWVVGVSCLVWFVVWFLTRRRLRLAIRGSATALVVVAAAMMAWNAYAGRGWVIIYFMD